MDEGEFPTDSGEYFLWESFGPNQTPIPLKQPNTSLTSKSQTPALDSALDVQGWTD